MTYPDISQDLNCSPQPLSPPGATLREFPSIVIQVGHIVKKYVGRDVAISIPFVHIKDIEGNKFSRSELVQKVFRKKAVCNADFGDNTPFYRRHRRDEIFPVGKQPGIIEVPCLEGRIVIAPEASGISCSVHRVLANCTY